jgi:transcriptional antiterminator NusG
VQVRAGQEKKVKLLIEDRIKQSDIASNFDQVLVPTEEVVEMRGGQKRRTERKFYPGYVLVKMTMSEAGWHLIKGVPNVLSFIGGTKDKPAPIPEAQAKEILARAELKGDKARPKTLFEPGEVIRVTDGPFNDFNGVVEKVNYEKSRLQVAVSIFGRSTPIDLGFDQVEKT